MQLMQDDWKLVSVVVSMLAVDVVILTIYNAVSSTGESTVGLIQSLEFQNVQVCLRQHMKVQYRLCVILCFRYMVRSRYLLEKSLWSQ